jgi:hypothetical protein
MSASIALALRLFMALSLYAFLGWALFLLWRDINKHGVLIENRRIPRIGISIKQENKETIQKFFSQAEIILGRDPGCDVPLADDGTISIRHAQLSYHHSQWWVEDLSSTNGTLINEINVNMPTVITSGDEIKCGNAILTIDLPTGEAASQ